MSEDRAVVSCYYCHTKNNIGLGGDFYESRAFYVCCNCEKPVSVHLTQTALTTDDFSSIQKGEKV